MVATSTIADRVCLYHDVKTYSEATNERVGGLNYACHPTTQALMCAYAFDDGPIEQWIPAHGEPIPANLQAALLDEKVVKIAWDKSFEQGIWKNVLGIDIPNNQWRDPMVLACACAFPAELADASEAMGIPQHHRKKAEDALISLFSSPKDGGRVLPPQHPNKWQDYLTHNKDNVKAERHIHRLLRRFDLSDSEWDLWLIDQEINQTGIPINIPMVKKAGVIRQALIARATQRLVEITGMQNPTGRKKLLAWMKKYGYEFDDLTAGSVSDSIAKLEQTRNPQRNPLYHALLVRREITKSAGAKFDSLLELTDNDGRYRDGFRFYGAGRSGRWTGRGAQPQNLPASAHGLSGIEWGITAGGHKIVRGADQFKVSQAIELFSADDFRLVFERPIDALGGSVRNAIQAPKGYTFISVDLKFIEHVVLGWITKDKTIQRVIREGKDPYLYFASNLPFNTESYAELAKGYEAGDKSKRDFAKPGLLGCGFMMGAAKLMEDARRAGVILTMQQCVAIVGAWRNTYKQVPDFWSYLPVVVCRCVRTKKPDEWMGIRFDYVGSFLRITLPSGGILYYYKPEVKPSKTKGRQNKDVLTYEGRDGKVWQRQFTHGGKLTQNIVSRIARDIFAHGLKLAHARDLTIVLHNADQIVALSKIEDADDDLTSLIECASTRPAWWGDLPISVEGYMSRWFIKD